MRTCLLFGFLLFCGAVWADPPPEGETLASLSKTLQGITASQVHSKEGQGLSSLEVAMARKFGPPPSAFIRHISTNANPFYQRSSGVGSVKPQDRTIDPREPIMKMALTAFAYSDTESYVILGGEVVGVGDELSPGLGSIKVVSINKKEIVFEMKSVDGTSQTFSRAIPTDLIP